MTSVPDPERDAVAARRALADESAAWFAECFDREPEGVWLAPGRVNLIGEHTDYNEGFVLPFALGEGVAAAVARRDDGILALRTRQDAAARADIPLDSLPAGATGITAIRDRMPAWAAYPAGVAWSLRASGHDIGGASIAIDSSLAEGAGLSSSAALECSVALALTELYGAAGADGAPRRELAATARRAENEFVGVPSGIMDQSASLLCRAGHALLLDCRSLETSQVPFRPAAAGARLLVINTRAKHTLTGGDYGNRRAECEEAARRLGLSSLREVTGTGALTSLDEPLRRRARHVVTDNQRVQVVVDLLRSCAGSGAGAGTGTLRQVGTVLTESHASLRDDFEISWPEADVSVDEAVAAGAFGARMVGGGFGGSVIALVPDAAADEVRSRVSAAFAGRSWTEPEFLDAVPSAAAQRLR
ncbi:MAG TPA: galactokinase [Streptosporangiaceae bacterium]|nr:galactokinase [Streptosporangiaceae bacterium]